LADTVVHRTCGTTQTILGAAGMSVRIARSHTDTAHFSASLSFVDALRIEFTEALDISGRIEGRVVFAKVRVARKQIAVAIRGTGTTFLGASFVEMSVDALWLGTRQLADALVIREIRVERSRDTKICNVVFIGEEGRLVNNAQEWERRTPRDERKKALTGIANVQIRIAVGQENTRTTIF